MAALRGVAQTGLVLGSIGEAKNVLTSGIASTNVSMIVKVHRQAREACGRQRGQAARTNQQEAFDEGWPIMDHSGVVIPDRHSQK